ncbi:MAG: hypothetical protein FJ224_07095 [Lentisphaerae bacterium]|nr:hypothetical protein [Lentisphaerota bacterium]
MLRCAWFRWRISSAMDSGRHVGGSVRRHLAGCPDCRGFTARCEGVARELRAASATEQRLPPGLHARIARGVGQAGAAHRGRRLLITLPAVLAPATGCAAILIAVFMAVRVVRSVRPSAQETGPVALAIPSGGGIDVVGGAGAALVSASGMYAREETAIRSDLAAALDLVQRCL